MEGCSLEGPIPSSISALTSLSDLYACNILFSFNTIKDEYVNWMLLLLFDTYEDNWPKRWRICFPISKYYEIHEDTVSSMT